MTRPRRLRWDLPPTPAPKHPYRDTLVVYAGLAAVVVLIAWVTGGPVLKAVLLAAAFFVAASLWGWWRCRQRLRAGARKAAEAGE